MKILNADHFIEMSKSDQKMLLDYITDNFKMIKSINYNQTAYGLKARYNRITAKVKKHHVTSQCFMEAMVQAGYKAVQIKDTLEPNWHFNIGRVHFID